ncbi:hypothetical protein [Tannockella kyphosi]|uniref:hypothetical protein n=1 Tax=Tannockella kyphosi TaxID=2899121 RepID=UPI002011BCF7|nr:hypothetical protein [Tannockella kyphosi]
MKKILKQPKLSLFLYFMAFITVIYAAYCFNSTLAYINETYVGYYMYTWAEYGKDFILMLFQTIEAYLFYAIVFFTLGRVVCMLDPVYDFSEDLLDAFEEFEDEEEVEEDEEEDEEEIEEEE